MQQSGGMKEIGIHDLMESKSPHVFVLNTSDLGGVMKAGTINIPVTTERGRSLNVVVHNTFIPMDLSTQVAKKDLVDNPDFMRMVTKGLVTLVDEAWAKNELKDRDNRAEHDRIIKEMNRIGQARIEAEDAEEAKPDDSPEAGVNAIVIDAINRDDMSDTERFLSIRKVESQLKEKDWQYILKSTKHDRLLQMANNHLKRAK